MHRRLRPPGEPSSSCRILGCTSLAVLLLAWSVAHAAPPRRYVLGVIPSAPPLAMYEQWDPLVARLAARVGAPIHLRLYDDMARFEQALQSGDVDLVFTHPLMTIEAHERQGYEPLVRDRRRVAVIVFVRRDSAVRSISELAGKRIAVVGRQSYCTELLEQMLRSAGLQPLVQQMYAGTSLNAVRSVALGRAEAGAVLDLRLEEMPDALRSAVRPLVSSRDTASHPLSAHPRVPREIRARIVGAFLEMERDAPGRALLEGIHMPDPEPADYERDYGPVARARRGRRAP